MARPQDDVVHRTDANDLPRGARNIFHDAAALEFSDDFARTQELAREIHADYALPLRERHLVKRGFLLEPGVVDEHIDGAPLGKHFAEHGLDLTFVADVRLDRECFDAGFSNFGGYGFRVIGRSFVINDDIGAGAAQRDGDGAADAGTVPGHERFLAFEERKDGARRVGLREVLLNEFEIGGGITHGIKEPAVMGHWTSSDQTSSPECNPLMGDIGYDCESVSALRARVPSGLRNAAEHVECRRRKRFSCRPQLPK